MKTLGYAWATLCTHYLLYAQVPICVYLGCKHCTACTNPSRIAVGPGHDSPFRPVGMEEATGTKRFGCAESHSNME